MLAGLALCSLNLPGQRAVSAQVDSGYKAQTDSQPPGMVAQAAGRAPLRLDRIERQCFGRADSENVLQRHVATRRPPRWWPRLQAQAGEELLDHGCLENGRNDLKPTGADSHGGWGTTSARSFAELA